MWTDVIQVELLEKPWWDDPLPIAAILLSLASVWYTWWARHKDRAFLKVKATSFVTLGGHQEWNIGVVATNMGLAGSAAVDGVHFKLGRKRFALTTGSFAPTVTLPTTLAPDASMTYVVSSKGLAQELVNHDRKPRHAIPFVTTGRRSYRGKWDDKGMKVLTDDYKIIKAAVDKGNPKAAGWWARIRKL